MNEDVSAAIEAGKAARSRILKRLSSAEKTQLLETLFVDLFGEAQMNLQKWAALTGQSAQVDTGYIAQFVASIVVGIPGQGFRGKGLDLIDGSEVKSATNISGVDTVRWNHSLGSIADDAERIAKGERTLSDVYLGAPNLYYLLVDRPFGGTPSPDGDPTPFRIRLWCVDVQKDAAWQDLLIKWRDARKGKTYNYQLFPPVGYDDDVVTHGMGDLDFADILLFDARLQLRAASPPTVSWPVPLREQVLPVTGRTRALVHKRNARKSRPTEASDLVADIATVMRLFPELFPAVTPEEAREIAEVSTEEVEHAETPEHSDA